ncbi:outer membrane protein assembly factor BamE [Thermodesulfobacteriota bacterium]
MRSLLAVLFLLIVFSGCSKVTQENYDRLRVGMEYDEVVQMLGSPDESGALYGAKTCTWGSEKRNIKVKFIADKAVFFSGNGL